MISGRVIGDLLANPSVIRLRSLARGIKPVRSLMRVMSRTKVYEDKFQASILRTIRAGDRVWDVGGNVGFYTKLFLDSVGHDGHVTVFEPSEDSFKVLCLKFNSVDQRKLKIENIALGSQNQTVRFGVSDPLSPTNRVLDDHEMQTNTTRVDMRTADAYIDSGVAIPNLAKIDVEGYELEVIHGMTNLLKCKQLRALFIEIHFNVLQKRGDPTAPHELVGLLSEEGFQINWIDFSHISALR